MLKRKIRKIGSSLVITIPMQIAEAFGYNEGMMLEVDMQRDVVIFKKIKK
jgi:antitoxin component of MazEF toxin-antitoxin module